MNSIVGRRLVASAAASAGLVGICVAAPAAAADIRMDDASAFSTSSETCARTPSSVCWWTRPSGTTPTAQSKAESGDLPTVNK